MNARTAFDLIFRNARTRSQATPVDIGVSGGRIAAIEPHLACEAAEIDAGGRLVLAGFVDTHIHLDKACLLGRCGHDHGTVSEAIAAVAAMKRDFTVDDIHARGARVIERAIVHGTTHMRTHVEIDPRIALRGFEAIKALKRDYAWALDLSICVFPQEGLTNDPGAEELLIAALRDGADLIGGCPYMDTDPNAQIEKLFDLAQEFDVDVDLHLDFDLDPSWWHLEEVCRQTERRNYQGRVAIGHATKLSALPPERFREASQRLAKAGVATGLPDIPTTNALGTFLLMPVPSVPIGSIFFAVGSTIFSWLLLRGQMVPVSIAWLGVFASGLLVVVLPLQLAGFSTGPLTGYYQWLPALVFQIFLALWLLIKGVATPATR